MKRVVASYSAKSYNGRSWDELIMQLDRAGYEVDSAYRSHPHKWIEVIQNGRIFDAEVTKYFDGSYEVMEYNITPSNHNDIVDTVMDDIGDIIAKLEEHDTNDARVRDITSYLRQVIENIEHYRNSNYE